jgi:hypothetical protein
MLNISFFEQKIGSQTKVEFYDSLNRIPFSISIGSFSSFPNAIYARNLSINSFVDFRFNKDSGELFEISMISINTGSIINAEPFLEVDPNHTFICKLNEIDSVLEDKIPTTIYTKNDLFCLMIGDLDEAKLNFFQIGTDIYLGIDENNFLKSLVLKSLSNENLNSIFGF